MTKTRLAIAGFVLALFAGTLLGDPSAQADVKSGCTVAAGGDGCRGYVIVVPSPTAPFAADPPAVVIVLRTNEAWCDQHGGVYADKGVCLNIDY